MTINIFIHRTKGHNYQDIIYLFITALTFFSIQFISKRFLTCILLFVAIDTKFLKFNSLFVVSLDFFLQLYNFYVWQKFNNFPMKLKIFISPNFLFENFHCW